MKTGWNAAGHDGRPRKAIDLEYKILSNTGMHMDPIFANINKVIREEAVL